MRNLKRLIFVLVVVLVASAAGVFVLENQQPVELVFLGWSAPQLAVAVPVIGALLSGMVIGPFLGWCTSLRIKRKTERLV